MENFSINPIKELKNGIPYDIVLTEIDKSTLETITCPICLNLAWDIIDCSNCGFIFCKKCIDESIAKVDNSCPVCRQSPFQSTECKTIKKIISKYKLKCPNIPCNENPEYSEYITHQEKCKFRKYHCNNEGCNFETINDIESMKAHSLSCQYKRIICQYCNESLKEIDFVNHLNNKCNKIIDCPDCHNQMKISDFMNNHNVITCLMCQLDSSETQNKNKDEKLESSKIEIDKLMSQIDKLQKENNDLIEKNKVLSDEKEKFKQEKIKLNENIKKLNHQLYLSKKRKRNDDNNKK